jgi:hypothetical protein
MAKEVARYLLNSQLIVIPQMSHMFGGLSNEEWFDLMASDFIEHSDKSKVNTACVKSMQPQPYETGSTLR